MIQGTSHGLAIRRRHVEGVQLRTKRTIIGGGNQKVDIYMSDDAWNFFPRRLEDRMGRFPVVRYADLDTKERAIPGPSILCVYGINGQELAATLRPVLGRWPVCRRTSSL